MKRTIFSLLALASVLLAACTVQNSGASSSSSSDSAQGSEPPSSPPPSAVTEVPLSPSNAKIQFVGTHTGDKPDPRTGEFTGFTGKAAVNNGKLASIHVDIQTDSLKTEIEKLTNHLKSPDFFDVRQFPKATFASTSIESVGEGQVNVKGDLTLLGVTKSISFPAAVSAADGDLTLKGEFTIDRTQFGMDYGVDRVEKEVEMTVTVGG